MKDEVQSALRKHTGLVVEDEDIHELDSARLVLQTWSRCGNIRIFLNLSDVRNGKSSLPREGIQLIESCLIEEPDPDTLEKLGVDRDVPPNLSAVFYGWVSKASLGDRVVTMREQEIRIGWHSLLIGRKKMPLDEANQMIRTFNLLEGIKPMHDQVEQMVGRACLKLFAGFRSGNEWRRLLLNALPAPGGEHPKVESMK